MDVLFTGMASFAFSAYCVKLTSLIPWSVVVIAVYVNLLLCVLADGNF